uniref:Putative 5.3 kDa protein n=1 Tax=Ixodes ricinus TaxID=34613 RepID=A0A0K8RLY9_IXORI
MRATTLYLMAICLLVTANLVGTCIRGNDAYYEASRKYCEQKCYGSGSCGWPCPYCVWNSYQRRKRCKT